MNLVVAWDTEDCVPLVGCQEDTPDRFVLEGWRGPAWRSGWVCRAGTACLVADPPAVGSAWGRGEPPHA